VPKEQIWGTVRHYGIIYLTQQLQRCDFAIWSPSPPNYIEHNDIAAQAIFQNIDDANRRRTVKVHVSIVQRLRALAFYLRYLRLRPFPSADEDGRAAERYRLAALGTISTAISRLAGFAFIALSVHWTAPVLGRERFGIWATFSSLAAMLSFLDLGIGNALVSRVAYATAKQDSRQLSVVIVAGIGWLAVIGIVATILLAVMGALIPWSSLFRLSSLAIGRETRNAAIIFSVLFGLSIISGGLLKILIGQQRSYEAQLITTIAVLLACPAMWWAVQRAPGVGVLLLAGVGTQSLVTLILVAGLLHLRHSLDFRSTFSGMLQERRALLTTGLLFLVLQIGTMIGWGADSFLLAGIVGASDVAAFAVAQRLFLFASQPGSILNGPLWAAYADAHAKGDRRFIKSTLLRSFLLSTAVVTGLSVVLLIFGSRIVTFWTEGTITVPWVLLLAFAVWTPLESAGIALSVYLNGVGIVREQVIVVICFCAVAVPAKIFAAMHAGALGLVAATTIVYAVTVVGLYGTVFRGRILAPISQPRRIDELPVS
jgi:O-antigen/teichoic acid export membrane protein